MLGFFSSEQMLHGLLTILYLQKHAEFSSEYKQGLETGRYDIALRRLVKRREALRMARPFHVVQVSKEAVHFTYANGALCYTTKQTSPAHQHHLRILLLEGPSVKEITIDVLELIKAFDGSDFDETQPYLFKPLYHADGIVSCLYEQKRLSTPCHRLIIYSLEKKEILNSHSLRSTSKIFVRNNSQYLYYGATELIDGEQRWMLWGFSLKTSTWLARRSILWDLADADLGSTICFEIFGNHLYGVCSQEMIEVEDTEWCSRGHPLNSFYYAFRFALSNPSAIQFLPKSCLWRRGATDGPIDDRWNHLQLWQDEKTGQVSIFETRKEWLCSWSQRTCYRKQLCPSVAHSTEDKTGDECPKDWDDVAHGATSPEDGAHRGDNGFSSSTFDFRSSLVRSYSPSCEAFVDIVSTTTDDSSPTAKRLRLRVRRRVCPSLEPAQPLSPTGSTANLVDGLDDQEVQIWPPDQESPGQPLNDYLDKLLTPQAHFDEIEWSMDGRALIYAPKLLNHRDEPRSLVLISFDSSLKFHGLCRWDRDSSPPSHPGEDSYDAPCGSASGRGVIMDQEIAARNSPTFNGIDFSRYRHGDAVPKGSG